VNKSSKLRVLINAKRSLKARTDLGALIAKQVPNSIFVQGQPSLQASCDAVVKAGTDLATAITAAQAAKAAYAAALSVVTTKTTAFDAVHDVCVAQTEQYAVTADDIQSVGWTMCLPVNHPFAGPLLVLTSYDVLKSTIEIDVKQPPGMRACIVEISTDPAVPTSWQRLDGNGCRRTLTGYAPGTYWVRVANMRAQAKTAYTTPVAVIVK
jgi:hypothetical protein